MTQMDRDDNLFDALVIGLAVYNVFYGAIFWIIGGIAGVLFWASVMLMAGIIGIIIKRRENE